MAMTSIALAILALFFLLFLASTIKTLLTPSRYTHSVHGLVVVGEKTRLGSTPPSCHNKCNECHPCMAVQVPTLPSHNRIPPQERPVDYEAGPSTSSAGNRYSNYKPLGWKCRCGGHFYNP
ncbi:EPIDERMAL PATTERNING FACTOR-like protein 1 [Sesamum angolense]|uniref:Epidermal patterning factor-like protein n=1 Tax=Sesamum angolense TaxID=2727404 RepID=A0AAE1WJ48_9LAMI|nr:EPIDERMAL PATTERNING FACTOR-like protein 1 [Sesamum angolense]